MIAHVSGTVSELFGNSIIIDVAGIGYELQIPAPDVDGLVLEQQVKFYTHHHIREQAEELFGFSSLASKKLFELLITVQGVGPKAALAILSLGNGEHVRNAIANSDSSFITKASGVGKKTAERVVVDLADKVGMPIVYTQSSGTQTIIETNDDALEALMALGYTLNDATSALSGVDASLPTNQRVAQALKGQS
jgi:holliday junction DNA helicase RuvA